MGSMRWRIEDLPPHLKAQVMRQLQPKGGENQQPSPVIAPKAVKTAQERVQKGRKGKKMSRTEERFRDRFCASCGWTVLRYEPVSIWVSGGFRYTPDFLVATETGELVFVETKGSFRLQSHSRARIAFADASTRTPGFVFCWAKENKKHNAFNLEWWKAGKIMKQAEISEMFHVEQS